MSTSETDGKRAGRARIFIALSLMGLVGLAIAGVIYKRYADAHLRKPPPLAGCVIMSWYDIQKYKDADVAGTEPHETSSGQTVYLRTNESKAVSCLEIISTDLSKRFAERFAEFDPEPRAKGLLALFESFSPAKEDDKRAEATYLIGSASVRVLPKSPTITAISKRFEEIHDCRFKTKGPCPSRPPMPSAVLYAGVPSAIAFVLGLAGLLPAAFGALKRRRASREAKS